MCAEPNLNCQRDENDSRDSERQEMAAGVTVNVTDELMSSSVVSLPPSAVASRHSASLASLPASSGASLELLPAAARMTPTTPPPPIPSISPTPTISPIPSLSSLSQLPPPPEDAVPRPPNPILSLMPPTNICLYGQQIASYLNPFASEFTPTRAMDAETATFPDSTVPKPATSHSVFPITEKNEDTSDRPTPSYCKLYAFERMTMAERLESAMRHSAVLERREGIITGFANKCRVYPIEPYAKTKNTPRTKPTKRRSDEVRPHADDPEGGSNKEGAIGQATQKDALDRSSMYVAPDHRHCNGDHMSPMAFSSSSSMTRSVLTSSSKPLTSSESQSLHSCPSVLPNGNIREKEIKVIYQRVCEGAPPTEPPLTTAVYNSGVKEPPQKRRSSHDQSSKCSATGMMTTKIQNLNEEEIDLASLLTANLLQSCANSKKQKASGFIRPTNCTFCGRTLETAPQPDGLAHMLQRSLKESNSEYRIIFDTVSIDRDNNRKVVQNMIATATTSSHPMTTIICKQLKNDDSTAAGGAGGVIDANGDRKTVHNIRINKIRGGCAANLGNGGGSVACSACCSQFNELYINRPFGGTTQINMPTTMAMGSSVRVDEPEIPTQQSLPSQHYSSRARGPRYGSYSQSHSQQQNDQMHPAEVIRNCVLQKTTSKTEIHINSHGGGRQHHVFLETSGSPTEAALISFKNLPSHLVHKLSDLVITILHDNDDMVEDDITSLYPTSKSTVDSSATQTTASSSPGANRVRATPRENTASLLRRRNIQKYLERNQQKMKDQQTKRVLMHFRRPRKRAPVHDANATATASTESNA